MGLSEIGLGWSRTPSDGCRRYRPLAMTFDTRATLLGIQIEEDWEPAIKEQWRENQERLRAELLHEFGHAEADRKLNDLQAIGAAPWSIIAMHNSVVYEIRTAFVAGAYYPSLLGAAGLGERILNQLILILRGDFLEHPHTSRVRGKKSVDAWDAAIDVLREWDVFSHDLATKYKRLHRLRNESVHYVKQELDHDSRDAALEAINLLQDIVGDLFSPHSGSHFIPGTKGAFYLRRAAEETPFVKRFLIPRSALVSPDHRLDLTSTPQRIYDNREYGEQEAMDALTDEEFARRVS